MVKALGLELTGTKFNFNIFGSENQQSLLKLHGVLLEAGP